MNGLLKAAAGVLLAALTCGAAAQELTLREAVDEALARNPAVAAADARQQNAAARASEARAGRFPRVDAAYSATRGNNPVFVFGSLLEQGEFAPRHFDPAFLNEPDALTHQRASLTARYAVFDRFRTSTAIRQSRNAVDGAAVEVEEARQRIRAETITRYYGVLVATQKVAVATDSVRSAEADAKATRDRFEQGLLVESDALSADVQLAGFRQRLIAAEGELAIARAALATMLQRPYGETISVAGTLPDTDRLRLSETPSPDDQPPPTANRQPPTDDAVARAIVKRAPVKSASVATANAQLRLAAERGSLLPRVDAFGTFGASGSTDYTAGVSVTVDLFDRARAARVAAARADAEHARAGEAMARDAVTMEVVAASQRLRVAREIASVAAVAVERAEAAARIVRDRYEQGLTTITEQLRAQTALVSARFELLAARYESVVARAELLRTTGDLHDVQPFL